MLLSQDYIVESTQFFSSFLSAILREDEIICIKLSNGKNAYVQLIYDDLPMLNIITNPQDLNFLRTVLSGVDTYGPMKIHEISFDQGFYSVSIMDKNSVDSETLEYFKKYKKKGSQKALVDQFLPIPIKNRRFRLSVAPNAKELKIITEVLSKLNDFSMYVQENGKEEAGLRALINGRGKLPYLVYIGNSYYISSIAFPKEKTRYEIPKLKNTFQLMLFKNLQQHGEWIFELTHALELIKGPDDPEPFFPYCMLSIDTKTSIVFPYVYDKGYQPDLDTLLESLLDFYYSIGLYPEKILVRDLKSYYFLKDFCEELNIKLELKEELPIIDEFEEEIYESAKDFDEEDFYNFLDQMDEWDDDYYIPDEEEQYYFERIKNHKSLILEEILDNLNIRILDPEPSEDIYMMRMLKNKKTIAEILINKKDLFSEMIEIIKKSFNLKDTDIHLSFRDFRGKVIPISPELNFKSILRLTNNLILSVNKKTFNLEIINNNFPQVETPAIITTKKSLFD